MFVDAVANEDGIWEASFVIPENGNQYSLASVKVEPVWDGNVTTIVTNTYITVDNVRPSISDVTLDSHSVITESGETDISFTVAFNEDVFGLNPEDLTVISQVADGSPADLVATVQSVSPVFGNQYTVVVRADIPADSEFNFGLMLATSEDNEEQLADVFDLSGNKAQPSDNSEDHDSYAVDTLAPEVRIDDGYEVVYHEQGVLVNADIYDLVASVTVDHDSTPVTLDSLSMAGMGGMGGDEPEGSPGSPGMEEGHDHTVITGDDIEHATQDFLHFNLTQDVFYDQDDVDAAAAASDPSVVFGADNGDGGTYTESDVTTAASVAGVVIGEVKTPATYTDEEVAGFLQNK